ncbi:ferredoxin [Streptosporangium sp. NPDC087985]|uniref:ferredoxin n=1 Tax=Streptosporangium sp. NPDC087985 TaxID=3366196 RepID=UPI0037FB2121
MRVMSDVSRCEGFASCVITAPAVFDLTDDGVVRLLDAEPRESQRPEVEEAIRSCPRQAIWLEQP